MTGPSAKRASTKVAAFINAPRNKVYQAFLDPSALAAWLPPDDMSAQLHHFEGYEGGRFRISLRYRDPAKSLAGKTSEGTDTYAGRFVELVPNEKIVEVITFESQRPELAGEMRIIASFVEAGGRTSLTVLCEDIPKGIRPEDNEAGWKQSLKKLAALVE
jgi:uncharacterized protein YndB with AHSA1/START domain